MIKEVLKELASVSDSLSSKNSYKEAAYLDSLIKKIAAGESSWSAPRDIEVSNIISGKRELYPLDEAWSLLVDDDSAEAMSREAGGLHFLLDLGRSLLAQSPSGGLEISSDGEVSLRDGDLSKEDMDKYHEGMAALRQLSRALSPGRAGAGATSESDWAAFRTERGADKRWVEKTKSELREASGPGRRSSKDVDMDELLRTRRLMDSEGDLELNAALGTSMSSGMMTPATEDIRFMLGKSIYSLEGLIAKHEEVKKDPNLDFRSKSRKKDAPSIKRSNEIIRAARETLKRMREVGAETEGGSIYDRQQQAADILREGREAEKAQARENPEESKGQIISVIDNLKEQLKSPDLGAAARKQLEGQLDTWFNTYQFFFPEEGSEGRSVIRDEDKMVKGRAPGKGVVKALRDFWDDQGCEYPCDIGWATMDDGTKVPKNRKDYPDDWPVGRSKDGLSTWKRLPPNLKEQQAELDRKNPYIEEFRKLNDEVLGWLELESTDSNQDAYDLMKSVLYKVDRSDLPERLHIKTGLNLQYLRIGDARWKGELDRVLRDVVMRFFAKKLNVPHDKSPVTKEGHGATLSVEDEERERSSRMDRLEQMMTEEGRDEPAEEPETSGPTLESLPLLSDSTPTGGVEIEEESDPDNPLLTEEQAIALNLIEPKESSRELLSKLIRLSGRLDHIGLIKEADYLDKVIFLNFR